MLGLFRVKWLSADHQRLPTMTDRAKGRKTPKRKVQGREWQGTTLFVLFFCSRLLASHLFPHFSFRIIIHHPTQTRARVEIFWIVMSFDASMRITPSSLSTPMSSAPAPRPAPSTTTTRSFFCGIASDSSPSETTSTAAIADRASRRESPLGSTLTLPMETSTVPASRRRTTPCRPSGSTTTALVTKIPVYPASRPPKPPALYEVPPPGVPTPPP
mmetsp:Transcript_31695/g.79615  ORF Transcript_31695/g.79615 Transcript_31695/m.79615 type:complete len:215 (+) Transcript_31695:101-745(+)